AENFTDITAWIHLCPIRIPRCPGLDECGDVGTVWICCGQIGRQRAKYACIVKRSSEWRFVRIGRRSHRIAELIDAGDGRSSSQGCDLKNVSALPVVEVSEDSISCARRQHSRIAVAACRG